MGSKRQQTMAKIARERAVRERRERKQEKKREKRLAAAEGRDLTEEPVDDATVDEASTDVAPAEQ
jgi:hypothetical protein